MLFGTHFILFYFQRPHRGRWK